RWPKKRKERDAKMARDDAMTARISVISRGRRTMIAKEAKEIAALSASGYPEPYRSRVLPRETRRLGDAFGLTAIGVSQVTIFPGKESSMRHHHTHEDELIYVLEGELVLHTDAGEETLRPGM